MAKFSKAMLLSCLLAVPSIASVVSEEAAEADVDEMNEMMNMTAAEAEAIDGEYDDEDVDEMKMTAEEEAEAAEEDVDDDDEEENSKGDTDEENDEDNKEDDDDDGNVNGDFINSHDKNKDGKLSIDELFPDDMPEAETERLAWMFDALPQSDKDGDKTLVSKFDKDGDKLINAEELPSLLQWMETENDRYDFEGLDENKDGKLNVDEIFKAYREHVPDDAEKMLEDYKLNAKSIDKDGDSMISFEEYPALVALRSAFLSDQEEEKNDAEDAEENERHMDAEDAEEQDVKKPGKR